MVSSARSVRPARRSNAAQSTRAHVFRASDASARSQGLECPVEVATTRSNRRTRRLGCRLPAAVPGRLAERILGLVESVGHAEGHAEQVEGLALGGVGVSSGERGDRATEVALRVGELTAAEVPRAKCRVAATVLGVAPDSLAPVGLRGAGRVAVLLEVDGRRGTALRPWRSRRAVAVRWPAAADRRRSMVASGDRRSRACRRRRGPAARGRALRRRRRRHVGRERRVGREVDACGREARCSALDTMTCAPGSGRVTATPDPCRPAVRDAGATAASRLASWAGPIARIGYQHWLKVRVSPAARKREVRLVVGEDAGHQLDVRPVGVGQARGPRPGRTRALPHVHCFLPGAMRWSAQWTKPASGRVVVAAEEVRRGRPSPCTRSAPGCCGTR